MIKDCPVCDGTMSFIGACWVCSVCGFVQAVGSPNSFSTRPPNDFERWRAEQKTISAGVVSVV